MHEGEKWKWSRSVVSDPQRPHGLQPSRLLHPWDFPGKSTGVGCHCLRSIVRLQPIKHWTRWSLGLQSYGFLSSWKLSAVLPFPPPEFPHSFAQHNFALSVCSLFIWVSSWLPSEREIILRAGTWWLKITQNGVGENTKCDRNGVYVCISRAWKTLRHWWPMYLNWAMDLASLKCCGVFLPSALNSTLPHAAPERRAYIVLEIFNQIFQPKDKWCFSVLNKALPWETIPLDSFQKRWKIKG